jgi:hypothetical protein
MLAGPPWRKWSGWIAINQINKTYSDINLNFSSIEINEFSLLIGR